MKKILMKKIFSLFSLLFIVNLYSNDSGITDWQVKDSDLLSKKESSKLYRKCRACHGKFAEKSAMNSSLIINKLKRDEVEEIIHLYKNGGIVSDYSDVMKRQVKNLSNSSIKSLSIYISNLNKEKENKENDILGLNVE